MTQWEYRIEFIDLHVSSRDPKPEIMLMLNTLGAEGWEAVTWEAERAPTLFSKDQFQSSPLPAASVALLNPPQVRPAARFVTIIQAKNSRHKSRESQGNRGPHANHR